MKEINGITSNYNNALKKNILDKTIPNSTEDKGKINSKEQKILSNY